MSVQSVVGDASFASLKSIVQKLLGDIAEGQLEEIVLGQLIDAETRAYDVQLCS